MIASAITAIALAIKNDSWSQWISNLDISATMQCDLAQARRHEMSQAVSQFSQTMLQICDRAILDGGPAICDALEIIYQVLKTDPKQSRNLLLETMVARIIPGIGWLEYFQRVTLPGTKKRYDLFQEAARCSEKSFDTIGRILFAIIQSDLPSLQKLLTDRFLSDHPQIDQIFLVAEFKVPSPEIRAYLIHQLHLDQNHRLLEQTFLGAIDHSDLATVKTIATKYGKFLISKYEPSRWCQNTTKGFLIALRFFLRAWRAYTGEPDPNNPQHQVISAIRGMFKELNSQIMTDLTGRLRKFIRTHLEHPKPCGPLLWLVLYDPSVFRSRKKAMVLWRWAAKDDVTLVASMKKFKITREQLIEWYDDYKESRSSIGWDDPLPPCRDQLDPQWIGSILSKKSARSQIC